jgi:hypothetical protein
MQKGNRKHAWLYVIVIILIAVMLVSFYYQFGYLPQKQSRTSFQEPVGPIWGQSGTSSQGTFGSTVRPNIVGGPDIFATLSFSNATGFVTTLHPTSGTTEFVMLPNITGEFTVSYMSSNNLTVLFFTDQDPVLKVDLSNGTLGTGSGLRVTESTPILVNPHQVIVNYTVTSEGSDGLYVFGLPSTSLNTPIIDVGTQPYTGPLTWLNGIIY